MKENIIFNFEQRQMLNEITKKVNVEIKKIQQKIDLLENPEGELTEKIKVLNDFIKENLGGTSKNDDDTTALSNIQRTVNFKNHLERIDLYLRVLSLALSVKLTLLNATSSSEEDSEKNRDEIVVEIKKKEVEIEYYLTAVNFILKTKLDLLKEFYSKLSDLQSDINDDTGFLSICSNARDIYDLCQRQNLCLKMNGYRIDSEIIKINSEIIQLLNVIGINSYYNISHLQPKLKENLVRESVNDKYVEKFQRVEPVPDPSMYPHLFLKNYLEAQLLLLRENVNKLSHGNNEKNLQEYIKNLEIEIEKHIIEKVKKIEENNASLLKHQRVYDKNYLKEKGEENREFLRELDSKVSELEAEMRKISDIIQKKEKNIEEKQHDRENLNLLSCINEEMAAFSFFGRSNDTEQEKNGLNPEQNQWDKGNALTR